MLICIIFEQQYDADDTEGLVINPSLLKDNHSAVLGIKYNFCLFCQLAFTPDGLKRLCNELVKDGEKPTNPNDIKLNNAGVPAHKGESGRYYCGRNVLTCSCCDGICGPTNRCNCTSCQKLDQDDREQKDEEEQQPTSACAMMDSWTWGEPPSVDQLREALQVLIFEQHKLAGQAAGTTLSAMRLKQRLAVLGRYFIALSRQKQSLMTEEKQEVTRREATTSRKVKTRLVNRWYKID